MRLIGWLGLLLICSSHNAYPTRLGHTERNVISIRQLADLELTTEVLESKFCARDYIRLKLKLRYFNLGSESVILYRRSDNIMTYFISRDANAAKREKYKQRYSPLQRILGTLESIDSDSPAEQTFVILKPGDSFEVTSQADLPFIYDGTNNDENLLRPGSYVLEIRARTWEGGPELAASLRERWQRHGYLWTKSLISRPMQFNVEKNPTVVRCS